MRIEEIQQIRDSLERIKPLLHDLRERSVQLCRQIESDQFPTETVRLMSTELDSYLAQADYLEKSTASLAISVESVSELEKQLETEELKTNLYAEREIVRDYFRLRDISATVQNDLMTSKYLLAEKCRQEQKPSEDTLLPFRIAVEHSRNKTDVIPEADYDTVEKNISRSIARALDRNNLEIDANADISEYLDGSCPLLEKDEGATPSKDDNEVPKSPTESGAGEAITISESADDTKRGGNANEKPEEDDNEPNHPALAEDIHEEAVADDTDEEKHDELILELDGVFGVEPIVKTDYPGSELGSKAFNGDLTKDPGLGWLLYFLGLGKLYSTKWGQDNNQNVYVPSDATLAFARKQHYLTSVTLAVPGSIEAEEYHILSSKGWECFHKQDVRKRLEGSKVNLLPPKNAQMSVTDWTETNGKRIGLICEYCRKHYPPHNMCILKYNVRNVWLPVGLCVQGNETVDLLAAVFSRGSESQELDALTSYISENETPVVLIAISEKDRLKIRDALSARVPTKNNIQLALIEESESIPLFDHIEDPAGQEEVTSPGDEQSADIAGKAEDRAAEAGDSSPNTLCHGNKWQEQLNYYKRAARQMISRGRSPEAITLLKVLAKYGEKEEAEYRQFAYAMMDPTVKKQYKYSELLQVFPDPFGSSCEYDALGLSAYLRIFFEEDLRTELFYLSDIKSQVNQTLLCEEIPKLKDLFFSLSSMAEKTGCGFDKTSMSLLLGQQGLREKVEEYRKRAAMRESSRLEEININHSRIKDTYKTIFATDGSLRRALSDAAAMQTDAIPRIQKELERYLAEPFTPGREYDAKDLSDAAIESAIDTAWSEQMQGVNHLRRETLTGIARANLKQRMREIIVTSLSWASLEASANHDIQNSTRRDMFVSYRRDISALMEETFEDLCIWQKGHTTGEEIFILQNTLRELTQYLRDGIDSTPGKYYFIDFLKGNYVEVNEHFEPDLEADFQEITPFNLCKRIEEQSLQADTDWSEVLRRLFEGPKDSGFDFGHAKLIKEYLSETQPDYIWDERYNIETNASYTESRIEIRSEEFYARLEMAENYGWLDSAERIESVKADMEKRRDHFTTTQNYGFYFRTMGAYLSSLSREAEGNKESYIRRLRRMKGVTASDDPIFSEIERLIGEHMYTVAQDYMDQVEKRGIKEAPVSTTLASDEDALCQLTNSYSDYLRDAKMSERQKLTEIFSHRHRTEENNLVKTGKLMLDNWPRSTGGAAEKVSVLLRQMELPVERVQTISEEHLFVKFERQLPTRDYPHPIGAFGSTMLRDGLHVFLIFGSKDNTTLNTAISKRLTTSITGSSIILLDAALSLADRRRLAQQVKCSNLNRMPYVILDRVMALHLANQPKSERWNVFLKCALPFQYLNPFTESSAVELCPEMFIGRRDELNEVTSPEGANIIYGGRQLGKTALLHRARKIEDSRAEGKWAIYIDIKKKKGNEAAQFVYEKLQDEDFLESSGNRVDWNELARLVITRIRKGKPEVKKFLLLLDEAGDYLADCTVNSAVPVDCLKRIQIDTENRFKFVLAGLHDVLRFYEKSMEPNSTLPHLNAITVKPLPFIEACELLEKPLAYLGFRIDKDNMPLITQILSSTNYFPGLIQYYASRLVRSVCQDDYGDATEKPPYKLAEHQILKLLKEKDFLDKIKEKFTITLDDDKDDNGYYWIIANSLAYAYYDKPQNILCGYTAEEIVDVCKTLDIRSVINLPLQSVELLLDELVELNILRRNKTDRSSRYVFSRTSFRHMLGDMESIYKTFEDIMQREEDAAHG